MNPLFHILNLLGAPFLRFAWPEFWQSGILASVLFVLNFALRKKVRATVRYMLWMLLLLKLVLPASLALPTSVGYWVPVAPSAALPEDISPPVFAEARISSTLPPPAASRTLQPPPSVTPAVSLPALSWPALLFAAWLCGFLLLTAVFLLRAAQARRLAARAVPTDEFSGLLSDCARQIGLPSRIGLKWSDAVETPAVCGLFRPVILLPTALAGKLEPAQMRAVLLHELAHVRRKDLWVALGQTALQIFYFYNPFLWLANAGIRRAREEAVDEMVLVAMAGDAALYPETLLNVARLSLPAPRLAFGFAGILESKSTLGARIRLMLQRPWPASAKVGLPAAAALLVLALVLLPMSYANKMPSCQGKTAAQWFSQYDETGDSYDRANVEAVNAFKQMGGAAVPYLRKILAHPPAPPSGAAFRQWTVKILPPLRKVLALQSRPVSGVGRPQPVSLPHQAASLLERMGPSAAPALPELLAALAGKDRDVDAGQAALVLCAIGPSARAAVPPLFKELEAGNIFAGRALVAIDPESPALVPALIAVVQHPPATQNSDQAVVESLCDLKELGPRAAAAVPALRAVLRQTNVPRFPGDGDPRVFAAWALQKIDPDQSDIQAEIYSVLHPPPGPLPDFEQLLTNAENADQHARGSESLGSALYKLAGALNALRSSGSIVPEATIQERILPLFDRALDPANPQDAVDVFGAASALGRSGAPLLPKVLAYLTTNDSGKRLNAVGALSAIAPGDPATLPTLIRLLDDPADPIKQNACAALVHFGPEARAAIPALRRCLKEDKLWTRFNATVALWRIAQEPPSIPLLQAAISEDDSGDYIPLRTLEMLGSLKAQTEETKSIIRQFTRSQNKEVRTNALSLLAKIEAR